MTGHLGLGLDCFARNNPQHSEGLDKYLLHGVWQKSSERLTECVVVIVMQRCNWQKPPWRPVVQAFKKADTQSHTNCGC